MGLLDRFRRRSDAASPLATDAPQVTEDEVLEAARERVRPGFLTHADAVAAVEDYLELHGDPRVRTAVDRVWAERLAEEQAWQEPGDHARVAAAFDALAEQGVLGRMCFTCCQTCGTAEIDDERTPRPGAGPDDYPYEEWAYTFFHEQDAERLLDEPALLYLSYSSFRPAPEVDADLLARWEAGDESLRGEVVAASDRAVGHRVADALRAQGLRVEWDGDTGSRVAVTIDDWRKPLPTS